MTPGELNKIRSAVAKAAADLLARESNDDATAESLADELADTVTDTIVETIEQIQGKAYNLVVIGSFKLPDGDVYTAAVGPLSTRAQQRARDLGERFAWDYKTRTGQGKFTLVPLVRDPRDAWDAARNDAFEEFEHRLTSITPGVSPSYEAMRFDMDTTTRSKITADWQMDPGILARVSAAACTCGLPSATTCHRHPEGRGDGTQEPT